MRRTTVALLLCGCLLFGGCGSFQMYAQGIPLNDPAEKASAGEVIAKVVGQIAIVTVGVLVASSVIINNLD